MRLKQKPSLLRRIFDLASDSSPLMIAVGRLMLLVVLNLAGIGMFHNLRMDLTMAMDDILELLRPDVDRM